LTFIDTWGFKAFIDKKELKHKAVEKYINKIWNADQALITTDYIIDETVTLLSYKLDYDKLKTFIQKLETSIKNNYIEIIWIKKDDFNQALKLKLKYKDKLDISFTDMTSMIVMKRNKIKDVITEDAHFKKVGFELNPLFSDE
jgi:uncharacterized protein